MRNRIKHVLLGAIASVSALTAAVPGASAYELMDGCAPRWTDIPSRYVINENGYSGLSTNVLREVFRRGFEQWEAPCCSAFESLDTGFTAEVGEDGSARENIFSFAEDSWPRELGDPGVVLAVTIAQWAVSGSTCSDMSADMVFNAANHRFALEEAGSGSGIIYNIDAVTTHECGHWIGLGHSRVGTATMWPYYSDGEEVLDSDDEAGACFLYPRVCGCTTAADCPAGDECLDGACVTPPCGSDSDCDVGFVCNFVTGNCDVAPCVSDDECPGTQVCEAGECRPVGDCPVCATCETVDDCGGPPYVCSDILGDGSPICTRICSVPEDCPGNSACFNVEGESFAVCLNEDAIDEGACPLDYLCDVPDCSEIVCSEGYACNEELGQCVRDDDCIVCDDCSSSLECPGGVCFDLGNLFGNCASPCETTEDCPANAECVEFGSGPEVVKYCLNDDWETADFCPRSYNCSLEEEVDLCAEVVCPEVWQACDEDTGECVGEAPVTGRGGDCAVCDECRNDTDCRGGICTEFSGVGRVCTVDCSNSGCPGNTSCFQIPVAGGAAQSVCLNDDVATAGVCQPEFVCDTSGGNAEIAENETPDILEEVTDGRPDTSTPDADAPADAGQTGIVTNVKTGCASATGHPKGFVFWLSSLALVVIGRRRLVHRAKI